MSHHNISDGSPCNCCRAGLWIRPLVDASLERVTRTFHASGVEFRIQTSHSFPSCLVSLVIDLLHIHVAFFIWLCISSSSPIHTKSTPEAPSPECGPCRSYVLAGRFLRPLYRIVNAKRTHLASGSRPPLNLNAPVEHCRQHLARKAVTLTTCLSVGDSGLLPLGLLIKCMAFLLISPTPTLNLNYLF